MQMQRSAALPLLPLLLMVVLTVATSGCGVGAPTFDATSPETMDTSMKEMTTKLSPAEQREFEEAMVFLPIVPTAQAAASGERPKLVDFNNAIKALDGMTAKQIIAMAKTRREELQAANAK